MKRIALPILITILTLQLTSCGKSQTTFDVVLTDYKYSPDTITVKAGDEITLNIKNDGFVSHMFIVFKLGTDAGDKFGVEDEENIYWKTEVLPGDSVTVKFTAPSEPGEYYVTCGLGGHHEVGMVGKLIVVDR